jgi:hypothetical protein
VKFIHIQPYQQWCYMVVVPFSFLLQDTALPAIRFSQCVISIYTSVVLNVFCSTGFEVLTVVRIHNAIWIRTLYCPVHGY